MVEARRRLSLRAHHDVQRYHRGRFRREHRAAAPRHARQAARRRARSAQQPGRRARVRGRSRRPAARDRRHRDRRRPHTRRALHHGSDAGRGVARRAGGGAGERLHRVGGGDPRRRAAGSSSRRVVRPAHLRQGLGADRDAAQRKAAPSSSPPRATSRHRAAPSRATASIPTTPSRTSTACRSISTMRACARRWRARDAGIHAALELLKGHKPKAGARHDGERGRRAVEMTRAWN